jgi:hypothetical protein
MVIASGIALRNLQARKYQKKVGELENKIKSAGQDISMDAKSSRKRASVWEGIQYIGGLIFGTSPFGAPVAGLYVEEAINTLGFGDGVVGIGYEMAIPTITYVFGSMILWGLANIRSTYHRDGYLEELQKQVGEENE